MSYSDRKRRRLEVKIESARLTEQIVMLHNQAGDLESQLRRQVFDELLASDPEVIEGVVADLLTIIIAHHMKAGRGAEGGESMAREADRAFMAKVADQAAEELRRMEDPRFDDPAS